MKRIILSISILALLSTTKVSAMELEDSVKIRVNTFVIGLHDAMSLPHTSQASELDRLSKEAPEILKEVSTLPKSSSKFEAIITKCLDQIFEKQDKIAAGIFTEEKNINDPNLVFVDVSNL